MEEKTVSTDAVKNVFKNGRMPTKEEYTKVWIDLINHIERMKANQCNSMKPPDEGGRNM